jgi:hypothetical protein
MCQNLLKNRSLMSGNTIGAKFFSDGKQIAPMLPEFPNVTKCKKCNAIFWLRKLEEIGTYEWGENANPDWLKADEAEFLTIEEYFKALDLEVPQNEDEEYFIRQRIWWGFNDRIRNGKEIFDNEDDEYLYRGNCFALIYMLEPEIDNQELRMFMAELYRNVGNFEKCISLIDSIKIDKLKWLVDRQRNECLAKNRWVVQLI